MSPDDDKRRSPAPSGPKPKRAGRRGRRRPSGSRVRELRGRRLRGARRRRRRPELPDLDFTTADVENIQACADWAYIRYFECAFEAMRGPVGGLPGRPLPARVRGRGRHGRLDPPVVHARPGDPAPGDGRARPRRRRARMLDDLYEALLAVYEARAGCCDPQDHCRPARRRRWRGRSSASSTSSAGAARGRRRSSPCGSGRSSWTPSDPRSPDLARFIGGGYDAGLVDNIDRLRGDRVPDGGPRMPPSSSPSSPSTPARHRSGGRTRRRRSVDVDDGRDRRPDGAPGAAAGRRGAARDGKREQFDDEAAQRRPR